MKTKIPNKLAWMAFVLYIIGVFVPYVQISFLDSFSIASSIELFDTTKTLLLLVVAIAVIILFFLFKKNPSKLLLGINLIAFLTVFGYMIYYFTIGTEIVLIGFYIHLCAIILFSLASIFKMIDKKDNKTK